MKNVFNAVKRNVAAAWEKGKKAVVTLAFGAGAGLVALVGQVKEASAALPAAVGSTVTQIQTDGQSIFDLIFPVIGAFLGLVIVIKLFKRFGNKV